MPSVQGRFSNPCSLLLESGCREVITIGWFRRLATLLADGGSKQVRMGIVMVLEFDRNFQDIRIQQRLNAAGAE